MKFNAQADAEIELIMAQVQALCMDRDSRLVAPILGTMAARLYQGMAAASIVTPDDVRKCMVSFMAIALDPPVKVPTIHTPETTTRTRQ